jgi:hypothetical protein
MSLPTVPIQCPVLFEDFDRTHLYKLALGPLLESRVSFHRNTRKHNNIVKLPIPTYTQQWVP